MDATVKSSDALIVIDMQNDFLPGGRLPVKQGNEIVPGINAVARKFRNVVLTGDWHPAHHVSFASAHPGKQPLKDTLEGPYGAQPLWPDHCIQDTRGAEMTSGLQLPQSDLLLRIGTRQDVDSISVFFEGDRQTSTGLAGYLRDRGITRTLFCGLALDVCVGFSAIDAARMGFASVVLEDLTRAAEAQGLLSEVRKDFARYHVQSGTSSSLEQA